MTASLDVGALRAVRAAVLAVPAVLGAALAHSLVDGCLNVVGAVLALGYAWPAAVAMLGARRRLPALLLWLLGVQVATHLLLDWTCRAVSSGQVGYAEHLLSGFRVSTLAAHGVSILITGTVLGRADAGLWAARALLAAARRFLAPRLRRPPVVASVRRAPDSPQRLALSVWQAAHPVRRGPPRAHCA